MEKLYSLITDASFKNKQLVIYFPHNFILVVLIYPVEQTSHNELFIGFNVWQCKIDYEHVNSLIRTIMNKARLQMLFFRFFMRITIKKLLNNLLKSPNFICLETHIFYSSQFKYI